MSFRSTARLLPRIYFALLLTVFALGSIAHAGHVHAKHDSTTHAQLCDYCVGFAHLGAAPVNTAHLTAALFFDEAPTAFIVSAAYAITHTVAQARAPPR